MSIDELYTVRTHSEREDGSHIFGVTLNPDHAVFAGHFPGTPVLPGVYAMHIIKACTCQVVGCSLEYRSVTEVKFISAVLPTQSVQLEVELTVEPPKDNEGYVVRGRMLSQGEIMVKIKALLA